MIKSMTGFGRGEYTGGGRRITAEIKTVNHRYADISVKMPRRYSFAEERIKSIVKDTVRRGKAEVSIMVENLTESDVCVSLNMPLAEQYVSNLRKLKETCGLEGDVDVALVSSMPDVLRTVPATGDEEAVTGAICEAVGAAVQHLDEMRAVEGEKLAEDLRMRGHVIRELVKVIDERAPLVAEEYRKKLDDRINEILEGNVELPEERILTEVAIFADKSNITEELVRLDSHMKQLDSILAGESGPIGKKLDFLVQEMNREANTIGSKANDLEITGYMLDAKSEIEKIREQVQNIE
ncbi:MAG: YicC family protein [Clostridiales bacterium]|nr:YicC family protein [Clostridiales bacterium]MDD7035424.1 YicC family protein [Bacillota bacterium]MDY2920000.1 YicC/YloC family endoribonuclease [Lentihominibacter sp.]